jgi:hypothetical protein
MSEKPKYNQSETIVIKRSQINFAPYNPKKHSKEAIAEQRRNIKRVGILGGIIWNKVTGNLVSGHKRTMALDELNKYDGTPETDYDIKVEMVEMDEKTEKEQNIYMDAQGTNTQQDIDLLAVIIPDIDFKNAGLSDEDLQLIGVDFTLQTEEERDITSAFDELNAPAKKVKEAEKKAKKEKTEEEKIAHNKEVKAQVMADAQEKAENMESYVMIPFDTYKRKAAFMERFGFDPREKFIKGEVFENMIERVE